MKKILIVVDMQNDFLTGVLGSPAARAVVKPIGELIARRKAEGHSVVYTADTHSQGDPAAPVSQELIRIPRHCAKDSEGWQIASDLKPDAASKVVEKSGFMSLGLPEAIGDIDPDDVLELCGVCTDICVASNALYLRACYPNNRIVVRADCCAGTTEENHAAALAVMGSCLIDIE